MKDEIICDYLTQSMMEIKIPLNKKYSIIICAQGKYGKSSIYEPALDIEHCGKIVTDCMIDRPTGKVIRPTIQNLIMAVDIINEAQAQYDASREAPKED